eukprot:TRINITY_DN189_c0_g1_i4.p1 TRINITY_DN189_c0_g1~~TRINITY_DN189_c0_g1_i4.p1  ORF type:complete len:1076 (-),score=226.31 TRINITY_DN189_c0_g1_i4:347-3130(-)
MSTVPSGDTSQTVWNQSLARSLRIQVVQERISQWGQMVDVWNAQLPVTSTKVYSNDDVVFYGSSKIASAPFVLPLVSSDINAKHEIATAQTQLLALFDLTAKSRDGFFISCSERIRGELTTICSNLDDPVTLKKCKCADKQCHRVMNPTLLQKKIFSRVQSTFCLARQKHNHPKPRGIKEEQSELVDRMRQSTRVRLPATSSSSSTTSSSSSSWSKFAIYPAFKSPKHSTDSENRQRHEWKRWIRLTEDIGIVCQLMKRAYFHIVHHFVDDTIANDNPNRRGRHVPTLTDKLLNSIAWDPSALIRQLRVLLYRQEDIYLNKFPGFSFSLTTASMSHATTLFAIGKPSDETTTESSSSSSSSNSQTSSSNWVLVWSKDDFTERELSALKSFSEIPGDFASRTIADVKGALQALYNSNAVVEAIRDYVNKVKEANDGGEITLDQLEDIYAQQQNKSQRTIAWSFRQIHLGQHLGLPRRSTITGPIKLPSCKPPSLRTDGQLTKEKMVQFFHNRKLPSTISPDGLTTGINNTMLLAAMFYFIAWDDLIMEQQDHEPTDDHDEQRQRIHEIQTWVNERKEQLGSKFYKNPADTVVDLCKQPSFSTWFPWTTCFDESKLTMAAILCPLASGMSKNARDNMTGCIQSGVGRVSFVVNTMRSADYSGQLYTLENFLGVKQQIRPLKQLRLDSIDTLRDMGFGVDDPGNTADNYYSGIIASGFKREGDLFVIASVDAIQTETVAVKRARTKHAESKRTLQSTKGSNADRVVKALNAQRVEKPKQAPKRPDHQIVLVGQKSRTSSMSSVSDWDAISHHVPVIQLREAFTSQKHSRTFKQVGFNRACGSQAPLGKTQFCPEQTTLISLKGNENAVKEEQAMFRAVQHIHGCEQTFNRDRNSIEDFVLLFLFQCLFSKRPEEFTPDKRNNTTSGQAME